MTLHQWTICLIMCHSLLTFFRHDLYIANDKLLAVLMSSWKFWECSHIYLFIYFFLIARCLYTSGWYISRVINQITLACSWKASANAANIVSALKINRSWLGDSVFSCGGVGPNKKSWDWWQGQEHLHVQLNGGCIFTKKKKKQNKKKLKINTKCFT